MHNFGVSAILGLLSLHCIHGDIHEFPGETFNCTRYFDYILLEYECRPRGVFYFYTVGVVTGDEFLEELQARCSNQSVVDGYIDCMAEIEAECPEQFPMVRDAVHEKVGTFCAGNNVAPWLSATLQAGYNYNINCEYLASSLMAMCSMEVFEPYRHFDSGVSLSTALGILPQALTALFQCTKIKFSVNQASFEDCGSSWQDSLLTAWLNMLASANFGTFLADTSEVRLLEKLQVLKFGVAGEK